MRFIKHWLEVPVTYAEVSGDFMDHATIRFRANSRDADKMRHFIRAYRASLLAPGERDCFPSMSFHGAGRASAGEFVRCFLVEATNLRIQTAITQ